MNPIGLPEIALLIGNFDDIPEELYFKRMTYLSQEWIAAAAGSNRIGCVYFLNKANLIRLSKRENLQSLIMIGHGFQGDLIGFKNEHFRPENVPTFKSKSIETAFCFSQSTIE